MTKGRDISELPALLASYNEKVRKASKLALIESALVGEGVAKRKVTQLFKGRNGYTLTGRLLNSIYSRVVLYKDSAEGYIGSTAPYARAHEFGLTITTKNARFLWLRTRATLEKGSPFRRMTPSQFYHAYNVYLSPLFYRGLNAMIDMGRGKKPIRLFFLRKRVKMVTRPFIIPGVNAAITNFKTAFGKWLDHVMTQEGPTK